MKAITVLTVLTVLAVLPLAVPGCDDSGYCEPCSCDPWGCWCPGGYNCVDGCCVGQGLPPCMYPNHPEYQGWPNDLDLEPNDHPDLAVVLPCGDDLVATDPAQYENRCPSRNNQTHGFMNVVICPEGDRDFYAIYLLEDETITFDVVFELDGALRRDLDAAVWTWDPALGEWREDVAVGTSTNDSEQLDVSTVPGSNNPQGWYYIEVRGKSNDDLNYYNVSYTLNEFWME